VHGRVAEKIDWWDSHEIRDAYMVGVSETDREKGI